MREKSYTKPEEGKILFCFGYNKNLFSAMNSTSSLCAPFLELEEDFFSYCLLLYLGNVNLTWTRVDVNNLTPHHDRERVTEKIRNEQGTHTEQQSGGLKSQPTLVNAFMLRHLSARPYNDEDNAMDRRRAVIHHIVCVAMPNENLINDYANVVRISIPFLHASNNNNIVKHRYLLKEHRKPLDQLQLEIKPIPRARQRHPIN